MGDIDEIPNKEVLKQSDQIRPLYEKPQHQKEYR